MPTPSSRRSGRSADATPMTLCSAACAAFASLGPPRQATSQARPFEITSRLAHWWASMTGWRWTNVAMQPTASRTRLVTAARLASSVTDSRRGLARRLSPTQTASKAPARSASTVWSMRSATFTTPSTTARFARIRPNEWATGYLPVYFGGRFWRNAVTPSA